MSLPASRTTHVIRRSFTNFYPEGSSILIVGTKGRQSTDIHEILLVGTREIKRIDGIEVQNTYSKQVNVCSFQLTSSDQLSEKISEEIAGTNALMFVVDALDVDHDKVQIMRATLTRILEAIDEDAVLAILAINSRSQGAKSAADISRAFKEFLKDKNTGLFRLSCVNRLGLLDPFDFIGDSLTIKSRVELRLKWKEQRKNERWRYDEKIEEKKEKKAERKRRREEKTIEAKSKHHKMLKTEGTAGCSDSENEEEEVAVIPGSGSNNGGLAEEEVQLDEYSSDTPKGYSSDPTTTGSDGSTDSSDTYRRYSDTDPEN